jgi:hypothetical protein
MAKKPPPRDLDEVMKEPATEAERKLTERIELTLMDSYHHGDSSLSVADLDKKDLDQYEAALDLYAHSRSKEHAGEGPKARVAKWDKFLKLRDRRIIDRAKELIGQRQTDVLNMLNTEFGHGSNPEGMDDDSSDEIIPHFPLGLLRLEKLMAKAYRELGVKRPPAE